MTATINPNAIKQDSRADRLAAAQSASAAAASAAAAASSASDATATATYAINKTVALSANQGRGLNRTVYGRDTNPLTASKLHVPSLTLTDLASASGLSVHASGGICATTAGVAGTGKITLPSAVDPNKPFRIHALIELNGDTTNNLAVQLGASTGAPPYWSGANFTSLKANNVSCGAGNNTIFNGIGGAAGAAPYPAGTKVWLNVCSDGNGYATISIVPDIASGSMHASWLLSTNSFQDVYNRIYYRSDVITNVSSGAGQYTWGRVGQSDQLTQIYFTASSTSTRLIGVYVNVGELDSPGDRRMGAPLVLQATTSQDCAGAIGSAQVLLAPPYWGSPGSRDLIMQHHPNANTGALLQSNSGPAALAMYFGGYAQGTVTGCQSSSDFAGATSSNWGAPTGLQYRKSFLDFVRNALRHEGKLIHFGMSMGLMNALRYFAEYGEGDAIVAVSGACDLTDSFNNRGFSSVINAGYGAWYESLVDSNTGNTPESSATQWKRINRGVGSTGLKSLLSPHNWRNLYAAGTTYAKNDIVYRPYTGGISSLSAYDPVLNPKLYAGLPMKLWHGTSDTTIPIAQVNGLASAVNAYGTSVSVVSVTGGGHLDAAMFAGSIPADIVTYLDSL